MVRDLWDLRLRNFQGLKLATDDSEAESGTDKEARLFSSQPESDLSDATKRSANRRSRNWKNDKQNSLPALLDTLGICYLGGLLMRLPYRIADFYRWAKANELLFLDAVQHPNPRFHGYQPSSNQRGQITEIPRSMLERLPAGHLKVFMARRVRFEGGELHRAVQELVRGYHRIYEMDFPGINGPPVLKQYARELSLPCEYHKPQPLHSGFQADVLS